VKVEKMQPEDAVEILRKHGTEVTIQQATLILEFLRMLANIAVAQYLRNENS
jgi:hypothetical protein